MDFLIFYEHFNREMENIILLKMQLQKLGHSVAISHFSKNSYAKHILLSKPKVVVTPWLRDDDNVFRFTRFLNKPKLVNLQWEQIYSDNDFKIGIASTTGLATKANHICWGEASRERLIKEGVPEKNLKVTGAIQLDFCREEFNSYYFSRSEIAKKYNLNPNRKWILFISSFAYATYNENSLDKLFKQWGDFSEFVVINKGSRAIALEWFEKLMNEDPNIEFIYRPHPSENLDSYIKKLAEGNSRFNIISDFSVKQWIKVSDKIITWYSTSISEIYAMNKRFCIIRPIKIPNIYEINIMKEAKFITEYEKLLNYIKYEEMTLPISHQQLHENYLIDSTPAYVKVADYLIDILSDNNIGKICINKKVKNLYKEKHRNDIIVSLLTEFVINTNIKLSKIIPFKKENFKNIERYVDLYPKNSIKLIESKLEKVINPNEKE